MISQNCSVSEVLQDRPQVSYFTSRTNRTQCVVVLMTEIYYSKRIQSKISKGERHVKQNLEETRHKLPKVLSSWNHKGCA
jgi:hypothetical protein